MESETLDGLRLTGEVPRHVAVIMDGNGRWARARGLPRYEGHRRGMTAVREAVEGAVEAGVGILTLFAFSTQNWERPRVEILALMGLLRRFADKERTSLRKQGVEVRVMGELDRLDDATRSAVEEITAATAGGTVMQLNLMISYSGRAELVRAARLIGERVRRGELAPEDIDDAEVQRHLFTADVPDPDLLVRTSGEQRISNFLLWQLAYTEIHTSPVLWPDFTRADLFEAIRDYQSRDRRFGRVPAVGES
ncbi:MAG TPA: polyprenyl diphosphate synthase [Longimicrobiales bacterium]|nr:polyprenyl diphosphate synthase [Longimicrobiales bacterium]